VKKFRSLEKKLGFKLVAINIKPYLEKTKMVLKDKGAGFPVLMDDSRFARNELYVVATPTTIIVDGKGKIRSRFIGTIGDFEKVITPILNRI